MTVRQILKTYPAVTALLLAATVFSVITYLQHSKVIAVVELSVIFICAIAMLAHMSIARRSTMKLLTKLSEKLSISEAENLESFPLAMLVTDSRGRVEWYNTRFLRQLVDDELSVSDSAEYLGGKTVSELHPDSRLDIERNGQSFSVYTEILTEGEKKHYIFYYVEDTGLKAIALEYDESRPAVMLLVADSVDDLLQGYKDSERAEIRSAVERMIENWTGDYACLLRKLSADRYIVVAQERNLRDMISKRFEILDKVRAYSYAGKPVGITLSIGVSRGESFSECESGARQALDMALGRGGDQAAVRGKDMSYAFFGGVSKSIEKKTKVKTRIVASAIAELIKGSNRVLIMCHRFPDFDALGSAVGLVYAARSMGVPAFIVTEKSRSLAVPLMERIKKDGKGDMLIENEQVEALLDANTLLFVVDTHIASFTEFPELYRKASKTIVIDHHRKAVDYIGNAVVFYHDPGASSTSEMVTELLQYMTDVPPITRLEADSLLSGIMLDTKNFILRAGVRTFEAAAYLRGRGADTVKVKKFFASSLDSFRLKNSIVVKSEIFRNCAMSVADFSSPDIRIICSMACDEMLNVNDIDAAFVVFETDGAVNISARSLGAMNVQLLMEKMGGGGHQTMAAAQIYDASAETVIARLRCVIDECRNET